MLDLSHTKRCDEAVRYLQLYVAITMNKIATDAD